MVIVPSSEASSMSILVSESVSMISKPDCEGRVGGMGLALALALLLIPLLLLEASLAAPSKSPAWGNDLTLAIPGGERLLLRPRLRPPLPPPSGESGVVVGLISTPRDEPIPIAELGRGVSTEVEGAKLLVEVSGGGGDGRILSETRDAVDNVDSAEEPRAGVSVGAEGEYDGRA
jgi:hypothetical protein